MIQKIKPYLKSKIKRIQRQLKKYLNSLKYGISMPCSISIGKNVEIVLTANTDINIGDNVHIGDNSAIKFFAPFSKLTLGDRVTLRKSVLLSCFGGSLKIGQEVFFNNNCSLSCMGTIEIGDKTIIGENVKMYDHNHKYEFRAGSLYTYGNEFTIGEIKIGQNCWIASDVIILNNITIGDNCIIGAGCVVHKSVPPNTIVKNKQNLVTSTY